jgi:hypothetical protein
MKNDEKKQKLSTTALAPQRRLIQELEKAGPNPSAVLSAIKTYRSARPKFGRLNERERVIERFTILLRDFARLQIRIAKSGVEIDRFLWKGEAGRGKSRLASVPHRTPGKSRYVENRGNR